MNNVTKSMMKLSTTLLTLLFISAISFSSCRSDDNNSDGKKAYIDAPSHTIRDSVDKNAAVTTSRHNAITHAVAECSPAIVGINVTETVKVEYRDPFSHFFDDPMFNQFFGKRQRRYQEYKVQGLGSGFIISPEGYILTNHHVAGNATKVIVTMAGGEKYDAEIIGADKISDVCLLKIKGKNFPYLRLANSDDVVIGEWAIAFGNPFGLFDINSKPTVTVGVVSNTGINFTQEDRIYRDMIQTDAAISSGNSGGPLINSNGDVIGMNTIIFSTSQSQQGAGSIGIGFSIPINRVKKIVDILKEHKSVNRDFQIGLNVSEIDDKVARYFGLKRKEGVIITSIIRNSPIEKAGIEAGDIILDINGYKIHKNDDVYAAIYDAQVGDELRFKLLRDDKEITRALTVKKSGK
ncbi:MAG: Trypsin-like serine protease [Ignavibacteria bacterium]|nr:Trypsin-like serine protease [Ignavibacteria bacterium]